MSVRGLKKVRYALLLLAMPTLLPLQACDIIYLSKITINERAPSAIGPTENQTTIRSTFEDFCSKEGFFLSLRDEFLHDKDTNIIERCEKAWFYGLYLSKKQNAYAE
jgi:hypothetical protein